MEAIRPEDIKRLSSLESAGIRGGIHSKRTYLMALHDGSLWIFKHTGTEERDEIFVYLLAQKMFRGVVPEVRPAYVPKIGWGSAMRKVAGVPAGRVDGLHGYMHGNEEMQADLVAMMVMDYLIGNPDRHSNNWFLMHNDRLAAIDNGWAGEENTMALSAVFQPADLAGLVRDESLWPKMLQMMLTLVNDLTGRGDEARALAQEIDIDRKEAVAMVRLWEPKLQKLARFIQAEASKLEKARTYIQSPEEVPAGAQAETGPRGGTYYESEPQMPGFEGPRPVQYEEQPPTHPRTIADSVEHEQRQQAILEDAKEVAIERAIEGKPELQGLTPAHHDIRRAVKDALTRDIAIRSEVPYSRVEAYISSWASSSSDSNVESLALQMAAAQLFALPATDFVKESWEAASGRMTSGEFTPAQRLAEATSVLRAMYDNTQEYLKQTGIKSLVLYRGMRWFDNEGDNPTPDEFGGYATGDKLAGGFRRQEVEFHSNPLSSWATDFNDARVFANFKPEGADQYDEYNWESETFQEEAGQALQGEWVGAAETLGVETDDSEAYEKWKDEELADYGGDVGMWAYQTGDLMPPAWLPAMTRAMSVVEVPREKIIATALTGLGCLNENEVVISGGEFNQTTYLSDDYDGSNAFPLADSIEEMEIRFGEKSKYEHVLQEMVDNHTKTFGEPTALEMQELKAGARELVQEERAEPKRKPYVEEPSKAMAEMEVDVKEIPEGALATRLEALRNDPALDVKAKNDKMVNVLYQWWTRKNDKWRQASKKIYNDKSLSDGQKTEATAAIQLAQLHHGRDYKKRLAEAAASIGAERPDANPLKEDISNQYDAARTKLLEAVVSGTMDGDTYKKEQDKIFARMEAQGDVLGLGYDPNDRKLVDSYQRYKKALTTVKAQHWGGSGNEEWNDFYKKQKAQERRIETRFKRVLAEAKPLEKITGT